MKPKKHVEYDKDTDTWFYTISDVNPCHRVEGFASSIEALAAVTKHAAEIVKEGRS